MLIQIVEDDSLLNEGIRMALLESDTEFVQNTTIIQARETFAKEHIDIIILDINLPDGNGLDYLKWVRNQSQVLVLILTANDMEMDEVMGLTLGADDYITKPFSIAVLRARVLALARRIPGKGREMYIEDKFVFDFAKLHYTKGGVELVLSVNEQRLLKLLVENRGNILTRAMLVDRLWTDGSEFVDENALSVTINRLRGKLEDRKELVTYIQTIYGQGYMWKKKED